MRKLVILLHLILLIPGYSLYGDDVKKAAQAGFKFMDVEVGARAAGMGEAFSFIGDDADAIFYNPAGIAQLQDKKFDLTVCRVNWIAETAVNALGFVANLDVFGNVGFSILSTDFGEIIGTMIDPTEAAGYVDMEDPLDVGAYAAGVTYARRLTEKFMIGGNIRYSYEHLGETPFKEAPESDSIWYEENEANTIVYDIGTIFYPGFKSLRMGMSVVNFSTAVRYEYSEGRTNSFELPLTFKIGGAMDILDFIGEHPNYSLLVDVELVHPRDYAQRYHVGGELSILKMLKLRAGYKFGYDEEGWGLGAGVHTGNIKLDYAYSEFGIFDFVNRVSFGISF
jgi:hypothetical protein